MMYVRALFAAVGMTALLGGILWAFVDAVIEEDWWLLLIVGGTLLLTIGFVMHENALEKEEGEKEK